jgi:multidrug transporter EmrE-like cation transporter
MSPISFLLIVSGVLLNAMAQLLMKAGTNAVGEVEFSATTLLPTLWRLMTEWHVVTALGCYGASVVIWVVALTRVPVSVAYPMLSLGYVVNALAAWWLLGESLNPTKVAGIAIILVGVGVMSRA